MASAEGPAPVTSAAPAGGVPTVESLVSAAAHGSAAANGGGASAAAAGSAPDAGDGEVKVDGDVQLMAVTTQEAIGGSVAVDVAAAPTGAVEAAPVVPPSGVQDADDLVNMIVDASDPPADGAKAAEETTAPDGVQVDTTLSAAGQALSRREILTAKGGYSEAKLAAEAAEAAQDAAQEAEKALAIAQAAAPVVNDEAALADDGLALKPTATEGDADAGPVVVPLTRTKHSLSFRFLGREMLQGKKFEDPDKEKAKEFFASQVFLRGKGKLCARRKDMAALGAGVNLYLNLQCYLGVLMALLSVLAVPTILLSAGGERIQEQDMDPLGLAVYTLGNNGPADVAGNLTTVNTTVVTIGGREITSIEASRLLTAADFIGCVLFLLFMLFFKWRISVLTHSLNDHTVSIGDYAVFVKGLPKNATKEEVCDHFSTLYDLSQPSWTFKGYCCCCHINGRRESLPPVERKAPVEDVSNTGSPEYAGKWVCEVSMAYKNGKTIRTFSKMRKMLNRVKEAKYAVQRYAPDSGHADPKKHAKAQRKVTKLESKLTKMQKLNRVQQVESSEVVGAFVTFQHAESAYRCQSDYHYTFSTKCQPPPLRFRGKHRLKVEEAPPPSDVLWENIETSPSSRFWRRFLTNSILFLLLVGSFLLILLAQKQKAELNEKLPRLDMCSLELPAAAYGTYDYPPNAELRRRPANDSSCGEGKFFLEWHDPTNASSVPPTPYSQCTANCLQTSDSATCNRLDGGGTYPLSTVVGCYCLEVLQKYVEEHGVFSGAGKAKDDEGDLCLDSLSNYVAAQSLLLTAALSVVLINFVLQRVLKALARFERHDTVSHEQLSITVKVFLAQLLNTGIIVLIVHAKLPNVDQNEVVLKEVGVFSGEHDGFNATWYATVGVSIMITMLVQTIFPHLIPILRACVLLPLKRCCTWRFKASQESLNNLYMPQSYDLSQRYPILLNTLFVTLLYSAGLPLLLPLAMVSFFVGFWVDKLLLMRCARRPAHFNESLAVMSLKLMPWALILHLCITIWMYGNSSVLKSDVIDVSLIGLEEDEDGGSIEDAYEKWRVEQESDWDTFGITTKIVRENVFPLFFLLVLVVGLLMIVRVALGYFVSCLLAVFHILTCGKCSGLEKTFVKSIVSSLDQEHDGGFTDQMMDPVPVPFLRRKKEETDKAHGDRVAAKLLSKVSAQDEEAGWRLVVNRDEKGAVSGAVAMKEWTDDGLSDVGLVHRKNTPLRVWEVILEGGGVYTYHPMANPKYRKVFVSMRQAQHKLMAARRQAGTAGGAQSSAAARQAAAYAAQVAYAQRLAEQQALYARTAAQQQMYQAQLNAARARAAQQQAFVARQQAYAQQQAQYAKQHAAYAQQHGMGAAVSGVSRTVQHQQAQQRSLQQQQAVAQRQMAAHAQRQQELIRQRQAQQMQAAQHASQLAAQRAAAQKERQRRLAAMTPQQRQQFLLQEHQAQQARLQQQQQAAHQHQQAARQAYIQQQQAMAARGPRPMARGPRPGFAVRGSAAVAPVQQFGGQPTRRQGGVAPMPRGPVMMQQPRGPVMMQQPRGPVMMQQPRGPMMVQQSIPGPPPG